MWYTVNEHHVANSDIMRCDMTIMRLLGVLWRHMTCHNVMRLTDIETPREASHKDQDEHVERDEVNDEHIAAPRRHLQQNRQPLLGWLLEFYVLPTCKDISGWVTTCDSAHSWQLDNAAPLGDQTTSTMTWCPTQSHYPDIEPTNGHSIWRGVWNECYFTDASSILLHWCCY